MGFIKKVARYLAASSGDKTAITGVIASPQVTSILTNLLVRISDGFGTNGQGIAGAPPTLAVDSLKDTSSIRQGFREVFMAAYDYLLRLVMINNGRTAVSPGDVTRIWLLHQVDGTVLSLRNKACCSDVHSRQIVGYDGSVSTAGTFSIGYVDRTRRSEAAVERAEHFSLLDNAIIAGDSRRIAEYLPLAFMAERLIGHVQVRTNGFGNVGLDPEQAEFFLALDSVGYVRSVVSGS